MGSRFYLPIMLTPRPYGPIYGGGAGSANLGKCNEVGKCVVPNQYVGNQATRYAPPTRGLSHVLYCYVLNV